MNIQFHGKKILVSGSTAGIGLAIATEFARSGGEVIVNGRNEERLQAAIAEIKRQSPEAGVSGVAADLGTKDGFAKLTQQVPSVDILVNNLGIFESKPFFEITDEDWERFFRVNVLSGARLSRHYAPAMQKKGWGRILFISSESSIQIPAEMVHYGMTKTAQLSVSRGLAETLKGTGVTVNAILPGPTKTEGVGTFVEQLAAERKFSPAEMEKEFFRSMRPTSLLQRFIEPAEVAHMVLYVASEQASATTGAALRVDGGTALSIH